MIICTHKQGTPEWHQARSGVITASMAPVILAKVGMLTEQQQKYVDAIRGGSSEDVAKEVAGYKAKPSSTTIQKALAGEPIGDFSEAAKDYAFRLAVERINGAPIADEQFETWAMRRGRELEPDARAAHSFNTGHVVHEVGFITTDDGKFGASADGLIGEDGGAEYKCFTDPSKLREILITKDTSTVRDQVQFCLWVTGRKWWDFSLYCPALANIGKESTTFTIARDDDFIEKMELILVDFDNLVCEYVHRLKGE